jgi:hypothetical protein
MYSESKSSLRLDVEVGRNVGEFVVDAVTLGLQVEPVEIAEQP